MQPSHRIGSQAISELLPDLDAQRGPRYRALAGGIASLLADGRLSPDTRLPSERELARTLGISRATATSAYDWLAEQGLLLRRTGSGSVLVLPPDARTSGPGSRFSRDSPGGRDPDVIDLSVASLPAPTGLIESATAAAAQTVGRYVGVDGYQPYGLPELRDAVAERYRRRGLPTTAEQILITNGAQHAFDVILRATIDPGDRVLTELPCYPGAIEAIKANSGRVVAVPLAPSTGDDASGGWDTTAIGNTLLQTAPRLAYLIPDFQNPTGVLVPSSERRSVAAAARRSGTRVVVDESFIDIDLRPIGRRGEAIEPMAAVDSSVISVGSLSKPVWGGLRVGWIRADADTIGRLAVVRARGDMGGAVIEQLIACQVLGDLDATIATRCTELSAQRDTLLDALRERLPNWRCSRPAGGLSTWVELDAPAATPLTTALERRGVLLNPGSRFAPEGTLERYLRLPFALPSPRLDRAVTVIAETWATLDIRPLPGRRDPAILTA